MKIDLRPALPAPAAGAGNPKSEQRACPFVFANFGVLRDDVMVGAFFASLIIFTASLACSCAAASFTFTEFAYKETSKNVRNILLMMDTETSFKNLLWG
jgi:hypothetical protein